jgi:hypothetical protein
MQYLAEQDETLIINGFSLFNPTIHQSCQELRSEVSSEHNNYLSEAINLKA